MRLFLLNIMLALLLTQMSFSQVGGSIPSPQAADIIHNIDVQPSYFTGGINYSIPIWHIKEDGVDMPINLNYRPSGFKPNDHPGWVGTGFSLKVGGAITRKTRGKNDDFCIIDPDGYYKHLWYGHLYNFNDPEAFKEFVTKMGAPELIDCINWDDDMWGDPSSYRFDNETANSNRVKIDQENDEFYFDIGTVSGRFIIGNNFNPIVFSNSDNIKVEITGLFKEEFMDVICQENSGCYKEYMDSYSISGFKIHTGDGFIYEFGCKAGEELKNVDRSQDAIAANDYTTTDAWWLSRVISPEGEELVSFEYVQNIWNDRNRRSLVDGFGLSDDHLHPIRQISLSRSLIYNNQPVSSMSLPLGGCIIHPCYLDKITTKNSEIKFHTSISTELKHNIYDIRYYLSNNVSDMISSQAMGRINTNWKTINWMQLDKIEVKQNKENIIKEFNFQYTCNDHERLRLLKFEEYGQAPYLFNYMGLSNRFINGTESDEYRSLYSRTINRGYGTIDVDRFGYYNHSLPWEVRNALCLDPESESDNGKLLYFGGGIVPYYKTRTYCPWESNWDRSFGIDELENILYSESKNDYSGDENYSIDTIYTPAGGRIAFEYEQNSYTHYLDVTNEGEFSVKRTKSDSERASGIRIKSIKKYPDNTQKFIGTKFEYDMGILYKTSKRYIEFECSVPSGSWFVTNGRGRDIAFVYDHYLFTHNPKLIYYDSGSSIKGGSAAAGSFMGYSKVTEMSFNHNSSNIGKVEYYYRNYKDHPALYSSEELSSKKDEHLEFFEKSMGSTIDFGCAVPAYIFPIQFTNNNIGKILEKRVYDKWDKIKQKQKFEYITPPNIFDYSVDATSMFSKPIYFDKRVFEPGSGNYSKRFVGCHQTFFNYDYFYQPHVLSKVLTYSCFGDDIVTSEVTKDYAFYNKKDFANINFAPEYIVQLKKQLEKLSEGKVKAINYQYPLDLTLNVNQGMGVPDETQVYLDMVSKNMLNYPIEIITEVDNSIVGAQVNLYSEFNNSIQLSKTEELEVESSLQESKYQEIAIEDNILVKDENFHKATVYDKYDEQGNLLQYHKKNNINVCYYWGHNDQYPLAKIDNYAYSSLENNTVLVTNLDLLESYTVIDATNKVGLAGVNQNIRNSLPKGVFITTYTYNPLIGMTSQTDPNGITTYYEYDSLGRLEYIKDNEGNVLKKYEYHYKNQ